MILRLPPTRKVRLAGQYYTTMFYLIFFLETQVESLSHNVFQTTRSSTIEPIEPKADNSNNNKTTR